MNKVFHKMIAVCMAFVVLMTTTSFTIDMHYCGDTMVDFSFVHEVEACEMEKVQSPRPCHDMVVEKSCCSDEQLVIDGQDDLKNSFDTLTFEQQNFITSFVYTYIYLIKGFDDDFIPFKDYHPPFLEPDFLVLNQVFLI